MTKTFALNKPDKTILGVTRDEMELRKQIKDRCTECYVPRCWLLKNPNDDGQINLKKKLVLGGKRERVQIRRLLFLMTFKELPIGRTLKPICKNSRCCNPAHMTYIGWDGPSYKKTYELIEKEYLTLEQAREWFT
jgi:hypothetical protein